MRTHHTLSRSAGAWFVAWLVFGLYVAPGAASAAAGALNVLDYYRLLPQKYLPQSGNRERAIVEKDIANGYLDILFSENTSGYTMALFRKADGRALIGLVSHCDDSGDACDDTIVFLEYAERRWIERTKDVFPTITPTILENAFRKKTGDAFREHTNPLHIAYQLPHKGTTVTAHIVEDVQKTPILAFTWDGTRFALGR